MSAVVLLLVVEMITHLKVEQEHAEDFKGAEGEDGKGPVVQKR